MDDSRNITKNCQEDVDQQVGTAATLELFVSFGRRAEELFVSYLKEDTKRRKDDGNNDLADITRVESQFLTVERYACACTAVLRSWN